MLMDGLTLQAVAEATSDRWRRIEVDTRREYARVRDYYLMTHFVVSVSRIATSLSEQNGMDAESSDVGDAEEADDHLVTQS